MKDIARIECALIDIKYECGDRECKYCPMRTRYGECVIEVLDDGGPFADQAYSECVGKTGKRLLDKVDKGNADGKYTKKILAFMRTAARSVCCIVRLTRTMMYLAGRRKTQSMTATVSRNCCLMCRWNWYRWTN